VPLLVIVFKLLPPSVTDELAGNVMVAPALITSDALKDKLVDPAMDAELVPAKVKVLVLLTPMPLLMVNGADKVIVVVPVIINAVHADATLTVGIVAVDGIIAMSPATGKPVEGAQLPLLFQLLFDEPVQVYVLAAALFDINAMDKEIRQYITSFFKLQQGLVYESDEF
jgi:hypothetical protein